MNFNINKEVLQMLELFEKSKKIRRLIWVIVIGFILMGILPSVVKIIALLK